MSALGHKQAFRSAIAMSVLSPKADIVSASGMSAKGHRGFAGHQYNSFVEGFLSARTRAGAVGAIHYRRH